MLSSKLTFSDVPETMGAILERLQRVEDLLQEAKELSVRQSSPESPITQKELARYLGVTVQTIIRHKARGRIPVLKAGNTIRYNLKEVLKALEKKA